MIWYLGVLKTQVREAGRWNGMRDAASQIKYRQTSYSDAGASVYGSDLRIYATFCKLLIRASQYRFRAVIGSSPSISPVDATCGVDSGCEPGLSYVA